jgi:hypothetical protein
MDFVRDIIILAIALLLLIKGRFLGALLGIGLGAWAVMDLRRLLRRKRAEKPAQPAPEAPSDNKITITDLSDVKEVEVEKEA